MNNKKSDKINELDKKIIELQTQLSELYSQRRKEEYDDIESYIGKCYKEDIGPVTDQTTGRFYKILDINTRKGGFPNNRYPATVIYLNNNDNYPCVSVTTEYFPFEFCCDEISQIEFTKQKNICLSRLGEKISEH